MDSLADRNVCGEHAVHLVEGGCNMKVSLAVVLLIVIGGVPVYAGKSAAECRAIVRAQFRGPNCKISDPPAGSSCIVDVRQVPAFQAAVDRCMQGK